MSTTAPAEPPGPVPRRRAWWPGIVLAALVTALATGRGLTRDPLEPYYAASVRAMASDWHAFLFGAFDPAATVTMDKLPGAFWVQALLVRALGPAPWVMVAPQVVEMTALTRRSHLRTARSPTRRCGSAASPRRAPGRRTRS
jgi:4-amino-4-deoxy-L-arabinose transferase-like glycosyltransferase